MGKIQSASLGRGPGQCVLALHMGHCEIGCYLVHDDHDSDDKNINNNNGNYDDSDDGDGGSDDVV